MTWALKASEHSVGSFELRDTRIEARQQMTGDMMISHHIEGERRRCGARVTSLQTEFMVREQRVVVLWLKLQLPSSCEKTIQSVPSGA